MRSASSLGGGSWTRAARDGERCRDARGYCVRGEVQRDEIAVRMPVPENDYVSAADPTSRIRGCSKDQRVGCKNSARAPRNGEFAGGTEFWL